MRQSSCISGLVGAVNETSKALGRSKSDGYCNVITVHGLNAVSGIAAGIQF
jgi:hypothetical protein